MFSVLKEKLKESFTSVFPIALIVLGLSATFTPLSTGTFLLFLIGVVFLIVGTALFTIGADSSMLQIGQKVGTTITKSRKVWLISFVSFLIGVIVTIAEPDLQILAKQVHAQAPSIGENLLIYTVSIGVGIFLLFAMLRIVFGVSLKILLCIFYPAVFLVAFCFVDESFWALAFDSGGVTTGPMTVPFILSLGVGVATIHRGKRGGDDSFGLVALSSIGPVLAVLILGVVCNVENVSGGGSETALSPEKTSGAFALCFGKENGLLKYAVEVLSALLPIVAFFLLFQICTRAFHRRAFIKVAVGLLTTFVGLSLFLTGANVGLLPVGTDIGKQLGGKWNGWLLVPVGMLFGYFVVAAEPAVYVLNEQVERMSAGAITAKAMKKGLCIGVCAALGFAFLRIVVGFNVMWILSVGYAVAIVLTFFTPPLFTGIAFDSGGVASGAMVSSFVLPMAIGACSIVAPNEIMTLAYGCVALVALAPLISIQILGIAYKRKTATYHKTFLRAKDTITEYEVE